MATHFTWEERQQLEKLVAAQVSKAEMARQLKRSQATIFRELKRNRSDAGYQANSAHRQAAARHTHRHRKMDSPELAAYVKSRLELRWSPDQIDGRAKREFFADRARRISRQTIYNWLQQPAGSEHCEYLRFYRAKTPARLPLDPCQAFPNRPAIISHRERFGDWEGDTLVGCKGKSKSVLYSLVERVSGYLELARGENRGVATANRILHRRLNKYPPNWRHSCTFDNGREFAAVGELARLLQIEVYHTQPYKAWQRGTNENTNGLIRQYFPKGPTSSTSAKPYSPKSKPNSTTAPANASATKLLKNSKINTASHAIHLGRRHITGNTKNACSLSLFWVMRNGE